MAGVVTWRSERERVLLDGLSAAWHVFHLHRSIVRGLVGLLVRLDVALHRERCEAWHRDLAYAEALHAAHGRASMLSAMHEAAKVREAEALECFMIVMRRHHAAIDALARLRAVAATGKRAEVQEAIEGIARALRGEAETTAQRARVPDSDRSVKPVRGMERSEPRSAGNADGARPAVEGRHHDE